MLLLASDRFREEFPGRSVSEPVADPFVAPAIVVVEDHDRAVSEIEPEDVGGVAGIDARTQCIEFGEPRRDIRKALTVKGIEGREMIGHRRVVRRRRKKYPGGVPPLLSHLAGRCG